MLQVGTNVIATGSGSVNTSGLSFEITESSFPQADPSSGGLILGVAVITNADIYGGFSGPSSFGTATGPAFADSGTGGQLGIFDSLGDLIVPEGYVSGTQLNSSAMWNSTTIAGLGLTPGVYIYSWGSVGSGNADSLTVNIGSAIPEPATGRISLVALAGLGGLAIIRKRRLAKSPRKSFC